MKNIILLVALACAGCIGLGPDERLSRIAREEWQRVGAPERFADLPVDGQACIGLPGVLGGDSITMYTPWPWSEWDFAARVIARYELSKASFQAYGLDSDGSPRWYFPILFLDGLLHGPVSELRSWWYVFIPGDIAETER